MQGREFLQLARDLLPGAQARHRRGAVIHAYYALLLECRDAMTRWGLPPLQRQQVHAGVRLRLIYATNTDLKEIGQYLERLSQDRNRASYDLRDLPLFAADIDTQESIQAAADGLSLLDAIDIDPIRRVSAAASIKP